MKIELQFEEDPALLIAYTDEKPQFSEGDEFTMKVKVDAIACVGSMRHEQPFWTIDLSPVGLLKADDMDGILFLHATLEKADTP